MNNLQKALLDIREERIIEYDQLLSQHPKHTFSRRYCARKKRIIKDYSHNNSVTVRGNNHNSTCRLSFRTILVAILIMILATASVIAIVKPKIYYDIKEMIDRWRITFSVEGESEEDRFEPIMPVIPSGFELVSEEVDEYSYSLQLRNQEGKVITYDQSKPDGVSIIIDKENHSTHKEYYKDHEIVISKSKAAVTVLCEDNKYIYLIAGDVDESLLIHMIESLPIE